MQNMAGRRATTANITVFIILLIAALIAKSIAYLVLSILFLIFASVMMWLSPSWTQAELPENPVNGARQEAPTAANATSRQIDAYARPHEPVAKSPSWRESPEEFPLDALDRLGKPPRPPMTSHAITAAENAECDYYASETLAVDLGLLVYSGDSDKPAVYREAPIPDNARYVQPFAELWCEEPLKDGTVRLTLLDPDGTLRFVSEAVFDKTNFKRNGRHTVLSPTRLPIGDHLLVQQAGWRFRIEVSGCCIADHAFNWYTPGNAHALVDHMATDGELTVDLAALVEQVALTPLSLDELLNGDDSAKDVR